MRLDSSGMFAMKQGMGRMKKHDRKGSSYRYSKRQSGFIKVDHYAIPTFKASFFTVA
jgi:hypothetical protein